jgi:transposase-like protein
VRCVACGTGQVRKAGRDQEGHQRYRCASWGRRQSTRSASAFCGYRFPDTIIALAVWWYLAYRLPSAAVAELLAERSVHVDASTVFDWVHRFTPLYQAMARPP